MKVLVQIAAAIAVLSTGCVKAEEKPNTPYALYNACVHQAKSAFALVHAREMGKPREDIIGYVETNEAPEHHEMLNRIINTVYDNPKLDNNAAYDGELVYCMSHSKSLVVGK
ncbi:hypothetical protein D3C75_224490 [compost metagenome]